ncbi:hypothetical protein [Kribbella sp. DT2]|uniref:hypothetical protein n=1 Tax=Kribbella sp. DT2 TaxID=3393427 RepID=UPI003CF97E76
MSDQDLIDRLTESAHRADRIQLDPETLITAGRRRVRHRRVTLAASAGLMLAAVVAVTLTGLRLTTAGDQPPVAGHQPDVVRTKDPVLLPHGSLGVLSAVMRKHIGPSENQHDTVVYSASDTGIKSAAGDGTVAILSVTVQRPLAPVPAVCGIAGELSTFTTCSLITVGGQQVRVGQRHGRAYFAGTSRSDGTIVLAQLDKDSSAPHTGAGLFFSDVDLNTLVALVTDPEVPTIK